jgi:hypothetical protein
MLLPTDVHKDDGSFLMACVLCVALAARKLTFLFLQYQYKARANLTFGPAGRLFPSSVQVPSVVVPWYPAMLVMCQ